MNGAWHDFLQALRGWDRRATFWGLAAGALTLFAMGTPLRPGAGLQPYPVTLSYNVVQFGLPLVLALRWADLRVDAGARPWPTYGLAVLAVAVFGTWIVAPLARPLLGTVDGWNVFDDVWLAGHVAAFQSLGVFAYAMQRQMRRAEDAAAAAVQAQGQRASELAAARLMSMQAHIEPDLLFDALGRLDRLIAMNDPRADTLLADLIAWLRALQPRSGGAGTTLGSEVELLTLQQRVLDPPSALEVELPEGLRALPFAPMLLAPLARCWRVAPGEGATRLAVAAARDGARCSVTLRRADGVGVPPLPPALVEKLTVRAAGVLGASAGLLPHAAGAVIQWELPA